MHGQTQQEKIIMPHTDTINSQVLSAEQLRKINAYWRAANYLSVGQIYLLDNLLLKQPLKKEHVKPRLLGHWGTTPGLNFIYAHCNRIIKKADAQWLADFINDMSRRRVFGRRIGGLGVYGANSAHGPFVHVDVRGKRARW